MDEVGVDPQFLQARCGPYRSWNLDRSVRKFAIFLSKMCRALHFAGYRNGPGQRQCPQAKGK